MPFKARFTAVLIAVLSGILLLAGTASAQLKGGGNEVAVGTLDYNVYINFQGYSSPLYTGPLVTTYAYTGNGWRQAVHRGTLSFKRGVMRLELKPGQKVVNANLWYGAYGWPTFRFLTWKGTHGMPLGKLWVDKSGKSFNLPITSAWVAIHDPSLPTAPITK